MKNKEIHKLYLAIFLRGQPKEEHSNENTLLCWEKGGMEMWDVRQKPERGQLVSQRKTKTTPKSAESGSNKHAIQSQRNTHKENQL